jgi:hypothetical protein
MIKYILIILILFSFKGYSQTQPSGFPTQANTGWAQWGYQQSTLGTIVAKRDTTFLPRFNGTIVFRPQNIRPYFYDSTALRWYKFFSEPDTLTTLATQYDLTQIVGGITELTGDVTAGPGSGSQAATISNNAVTYAKFQQVAANSLVGNPTGSLANATNVLKGYGLTFTGGTLLADTSALATQYDLTQLAQTTLSNVGTGYRWVLTSDGQIKTVSSSNTILWDSTSNSNALTAKADTSVLSTQYDLGYYAPLFTVDSTTKYDILIIKAGESNAANAISNAGLKAADSIPFPRIQMFNNVNRQFESLQMGVNNTLLVNITGTYGLDLQLKKSMQAGQVFLNDTVYLMNVAWSGAQIQTLIDKIDTVYQRVDSAVKLILAKGHYPQIYIWYSQGINDGSLDSATWRNRTEYYISLIRNRYGFAPLFQTLLPITSGGVALNNTISRLPYWDGFTYVVPTAGLTTSDGIHWDSASISTIAKSMISLSVDTVMERDKYVQSQANHLKRGYFKPSFMDVDNEVIVRGFVDVNNLMRLKANLANNHVGYNSAAAATYSGNFNNTFGYESLNKATTGSFNHGFGYRTLYNVTTAGDNTAFGYRTLESITTNSGSAGFGNYALQNCNALESAAFGTYALRQTTSSIADVAFGVRALENATSTQANAVFGWNAAQANTSSTDNTIFGAEANKNGTTGARNTIIGREAGKGITGSDNVIIGRQAVNGPTGLSGLVVIGATAGQNEVSNNRLIIDNSSTTSPLIYGDFTNDSLKINGFLKIRDSLNIGKTRIGTTADSVLVIDATNRSVKTVAQSSITSSVTTLYTGDGTLSGSRTVNTGGFATTWTGSLTGSYNFSVVNTNVTNGSAISGTANGSGSGVSGTSSSSFGVIGTSTSNTGVRGSSTSGAGVEATTTSGAHALLGQVAPSSTNTNQRVLQLTRLTTGTAANGISGSIDFAIERDDNSSSTSNQIISKWSDAAAATRTSQFVITGVNSATTQDILTINGDGSMTTVGRRFMAVVTSSVGTLTLANSEAYVFNGTTTTWTLPAVSGTTGLTYVLKNIGSGSITLNAAAAANEIYSTSAVNTYEITAGSSITLVSNGTYFTVN